MTQKIGFIGLGKMGMPMARNILKAGFRLTVYNRSEPPAKQIADAGADIGRSPQEVGLKSDIIFLSLPSPNIVDDLIFGKENALISGLSADKIVVDTSTTDPQFARDTARKLKEKGVHFLDSPVSGGPEGAKMGTLTFMVGGESSILERCRKVMQAMGANVFHMGAGGSGEAIKLVNQILVSVHTVATAEAMIFAESLGLDPQNVVKVIQASAGDSLVFRRAAPVMASREYGTGWQTYLLRKDLDLILQSSSSSGLRMMLSKATRDLFTVSIAQGREKLDSASVIEVLKEDIRK